MDQANLRFVIVCYLVQIRGYWLLFDALSVALSINVYVQNEMEQFEIISFNFVKGDFESELGALRIRMMEEIKVVLAPFLAFAFTYIDVKAHYVCTNVGRNVQILGYF